MVRTFKYSTSLFRKATKCSAFLILPGMASCSRSSGSTGKTSGMTFGIWNLVPGAPMKVSVSLWSVTDSCKPSTSLAYSSCNLAASVVFILCGYRLSNESTRTWTTYSSIFSESFATLLPAESSIGLVRSMLKDSMHTLSEIHIRHVPIFHSQV